MSDYSNWVKASYVMSYVIALMLFVISFLRLSSDAIIIGMLVMIYAEIRDMRNQKGSGQ